MRSFGQSSRAHGHWYGTHDRTGPMVTSAIKIPCDRGHPNRQFSAERRTGFQLFVEIGQAPTANRCRRRYWRRAISLGRPLEHDMQPPTREYCTIGTDLTVDADDEPGGREAKETKARDNESGTEASPPRADDGLKTPTDRYGIICRIPACNE